MMKLLGKLFLGKYYFVEQFSTILNLKDFYKLHCALKESTVCTVEDIYFLVKVRKMGGVRSAKW